MKVTFRDRLHSAWWILVAISWRAWEISWYLPTIRTRGRIYDLLWQREVAKKVIWNALDALETRGDEVAARSILYDALTTVDWE